MLKVEKNVKHPYLKPIGGKFNIWFYLTDKADTSAAHGETSVSFLRYQTDGELAELKQLRNAVLQKILGQTEFESDSERSLLELNRPVIQLGLDHNFNRRQPWPLEYLDKKDVTALAEFISRIALVAVDGIAREGELALSYR